MTLTSSDEVISTAVNNSVVYLLYASELRNCMIFFPTVTVERTNRSVDDSRSNFDRETLSDRRISMAYTFLY